MILYPAIDMHDGRCVRLRQGAFDTAHDVADSALSAAQSFAAAGAAWVHMVDLDGARSGNAKNRALLDSVLSGTALKVQLGGGMRDMRAVKAAIESGVSRVVIGSAAVENPDFVREAVQAFGDRIAVGIDAADGMVAVRGWTERSAVPYLSLARDMQDAGVRTIIFTDIARDGMLSGANLESLSALAQAVSCDIIASGGVRDLDDIKAIKALGVAGAICGKSIYEGTLTLQQALQVCREEAL